MGKNHRHKKQLKSEKAKVKLKSTKTQFLPKGQNVTDVSFKIKPIVLAEQFKQKESTEALSKRKLNVKDLVSRLKHYNTNVKNDACIELSEMIKIYTEEIVQQHLCQITQVVCGLVQDIESKVRRAAIKVIETILEKVPIDKNEPFFGFISTNLRCAMTNINRTIQEDSLLLIDAILVHAPSLLAKHSVKILPHFFTLISKLQNDSNPGRTLTLNLKSQITSVRWRIKVLSRLYGILNAVILKQRSIQISESMDIDDKIVSKTVTFTNDLQYVPIYKHTNIYDDCFVNFLDNTKLDETDESIEILNRHIITLIPLLYETWLEISPNKSSNEATKGTVTYLDEESSTILSCILNILTLLWEYVDLHKNKGNVSVVNIFHSKDCLKFLNFLMENFPYCLGSKGKDKKLKKEVSKVFHLNDDPKCIKENLMLCNIYISVHLEDKQNMKQKFTPILQFLIKCLSKTKITNSNIDYLVSILKFILIDKMKELSKKGFLVDSTIIIQHLIIFYSNNKLCESDREKIFNLLIEFVKQPISERMEHYNQWIHTLPKLLCGKEISENTINSFLQLSRMNNKLFICHLKLNSENIIDNLPKLKFTGTSDVNRCKRNIVNIFYYAFENSKYRNIFLEQNLTRISDPEYKKYFIDILNFVSFY